MRLGNAPGVLVQFTNCRQLYRGEIIREDFWVRDGKIVNPEKIFFDERISSDVKIDCRNLIVTPGYIDAQINGGFGHDFSSNVGELEETVSKVSKGLLQHGVTSYCPTLVTSPANLYRQALPVLKRRKGGRHGAEVLGAHIEGPYINVEKKGAHDSNYIKSKVDGFQAMLSTYGSFDNVKIITVAPELEGVIECLPEIDKLGIVISIGHSTADLLTSEKAVRNGATFITHLFNAMLPFHHRDPGIVGVLTSLRLNRPVFYGMITDGIHTHPTALRIAYRSHPKGMVIVTDAIAALALPPGSYKLGTMMVQIDENHAKIAGTNTLAGSTCSMDRCVYHFRKQADCSIVEALEAATLHPARLLRLTHTKGTLEFDTDADFIFVDDNLDVMATFIAGDVVWTSKDMSYLNQYYNETQS